MSRLPVTNQKRLWREAPLPSGTVLWHAEAADCARVSLPRSRVIPANAHCSLNYPRAPLPTASPLPCRHRHDRRRRSVRAPAASRPVCRLRPAAAVAGGPRILSSSSSLPAAHRSRRSARHAAAAGTAAVPAVECGSPLSASKHAKQPPSTRRSLPWRAAPAPILDGGPAPALCKWRAARSAAAGGPSVQRRPGPRQAAGGLGCCFPADGGPGGCWRRPAGGRAAVSPSPPPQAALPLLVAAAFRLHDAA